MAYGFRTRQGRNRKRDLYTDSDVSNLMALMLPSVHFPCNFIVLFLLSSLALHFYKIHVYPLSFDTSYKMYLAMHEQALTISNGDVKNDLRRMGI